MKIAAMMVILIVQVILLQILSRSYNSAFGYILDSYNNNQKKNQGVRCFKSLSLIPALQRCQPPPLAI